MVNYMSGVFLKVKCRKCKNEQAIFNKATIDVKCLVCNTILAQSTGGKAIIKTRALHVL
ncbi:30S ribosomal protein S27e [Candidatus Aenigmatarchaeota archaeon]